MSLRIVVYAEGAGELAVRGGLGATPGGELSDADLGAAHVLVARAVGRHSNVPQAAVRFVGPLRLDGRIVRGSDLAPERNVRRLLTWPDGDRRPDLAVLFVDDDGLDRRREIGAWVEHRTVPAVVAVPVKEFESWLLADASALPAGSTVPPAPEALRNGEAKLILQRLLGAEAAVLQARVDVVRRTSFDRLEQLPSFQRFRDDLRAALRRANH